jgi:hypothetical protein
MPLRYHGSSTSPEDNQARSGCIDLPSTALDVRRTLWRKTGFTTAVKATSRVYDHDREVDLCQMQYRRLGYIH